MNFVHLRLCGLILLAGCVITLDPAAASAQFTPGNAKKPSASANGQTTGDPQAITFPGVNIPQPKSNLTPEQWQMMMQTRALQSRGRGQVRTGVPQYIPLGSPGIPFPQVDAPADQPAETAKSSSLEKRIAARKAAEEKKRAARDAAKAKAKDKDAKAKPKGAKPPMANAVRPKDDAANAPAK